VHRPQHEQLSADGDMRVSRPRPCRCLISHEFVDISDQPHVPLKFVLQVRPQRRADELPTRYTPSSLIPCHPGNATKAHGRPHAAHLPEVRDLVVLCTFGTRFCERGRRICHQACFLDTCFLNVPRAGSLGESGAGFSCDESEDVVPMEL
jgi:hypothetical protein